VKYFRLGVALLIVGLVTAIQIDGANASSSYITERTQEAYATFQLQRHGVRSSVEINVQEGETTSSEGTERGLHADIEISQVNSRGNHSRMIDVAGSVETEPGAFDLEDGLSGGQIEIVIPVCGAKPSHNGLLKPGSFDNCFDVQVSLVWTGAGELTSSSGQDDYPAGGCIIHTTSAYQRRTASSTGMVLIGGTNLAAGDSVASAMSTYTGTTTATCPD
jgi:hypothetical protein